MKLPAKAREHNDGMGVTRIVFLVLGAAFNFGDVLSILMNMTPTSYFLPFGALVPDCVGRTLCENMLGAIHGLYTLYLYFS